MFAPGKLLNSSVQTLQLSTKIRKSWTKKVFITISPGMTQKIDDWGFKVKCFAPKVGRIT